MCGVAGIFHYRDQRHPIDRDMLVRMTRCLAHRGPDAEGFAVGPGIGLGHRRLSIVDLSPTGAQPMSTAEGIFSLTYNGECYNHRDFRGRLEARGRRFAGTSDTETLLYLLAEFGPRILADVVGIFAFGLWDRDARRLTLARDPLGVKQLYYHDDGRRIVFASEIKALFECADVPRRIDLEALNHYLHFHTPLFDRTFVAGIQQVRPGEFIEITAHGLRRRFYAETDGFAPRHETPESAIVDLKHLMARVVSDQLMADVPVGAFFSGGIDSTAVAAFASRAGYRVKCFGVHFSGTSVIDERPFQEETAKAMGLPLELTTVTGADFPADLATLTWFQDQPVIGAAMIPMYYVSKLAARQVKVCLGGQGADEIFGGYARYALVHPARVLSSWLSRPPDRSAPDQPADVAGVGGNLLKQLRDTRNLRRLARSVRPFDDWRRRYLDNFAHVPETTWRDVFPSHEVYSRVNARQIFESTVNRSPASDPGDRILHWDIQTYLTGLFQQDDRMSMANSLESRVPLADPRLVRFALHTDFSLKLRAGATKWLLRQAVADIIPARVLNRKKVGFDTPAEQWMRTTHYDFVHDVLCSAASTSRGYWSAAGVRRAVEGVDATNWFDVVWKLLSIEIWAQVFIDRTMPRPPVDVRGADLRAIDTEGVHVPA